MRSSRYSFAWGLSWLLLLAGLPLAARNERALVDAPRIYEQTTSSAVFKIYGSDPAAVSRVAGMAGGLQELGRNFFQLPAVSRQAVEVRLVSGEDAEKMDERFFLKLFTDREVHVFIRWTARTTFTDVARALACGYVNRVALFYFGPDAKVRPWVWLALSEMLETRFQPAQEDEQRRVVLAVGMMPLQEIIGSEAVPLERRSRFALNAAWFLRVLDHRMNDGTRLKQMMRTFLSQADPMLIMAAGFPEQIETIGDAELWWAVGFEGLVRGKRPPFFTMEESRERLRELAFLTVKTDQGDRRLTGAAIADWAGSARVQSALNQRIGQVKGIIPRVNPVYHNALLSLGLLFEAAKQADRQAAQQAEQRFIDDFSAAIELERNVHRLLSW